MATRRAPADEWCRQGDWGILGALIRVWVRLSDGARDLGDERGVEVRIEPNHEALMLAAGADPNCKHRWAFDGEQGKGEYRLLVHLCMHCGLERLERPSDLSLDPCEFEAVVYGMR